MTASLAPLHVVEPVAASGFTSYTWLMIAIPLALTAILLFLGRRYDSWGHLLTAIASWAFLLVGALIIAQILGIDETSCRVMRTLFARVPAGESSANFGLLVDPLSMAFVVLVTFVNSLIYVYPVTYMAHDMDQRRFFVYPNPFIAAMLTFVLADSYAIFFAGWEGVGLASYLPIGFWNRVSASTRAAKKVFLMGRVGDMGMLLAMMAMVANFSLVRLSDANAGVVGLPQAQATLISMFLLVTAYGKSAQLPLQAWPGGTMAGPTPVSTFIHAATTIIVDAYLVVRSGVVYTAVPVVASVIAIVGAITLLFGVIIGSVKDGTKKVLAASIMSQIGYIMLGTGFGPIGWVFAVFHPFTRGFSRTLMFLGAGSVMHAMNDQADMRRFDALRITMKVTWASFMVGWLTILGVPPLSGFWSRGKIIEAASSARSFDTLSVSWAGWFFGLIVLSGAGLTTFYTS